MKSIEYNGYTIYEDGQIIGKRGKPLKLCDNGRGYLIVTILYQGISKTKAVHTLVAELFVSNPNNLPEVDHIDGNKLNNHFKNLRWVTRGKNIEHCFSLGKRNAKGVSNANSKLSEKKVKRICELLQLGFTQAQIRDMGYPYATIRAIKQKRQWTHISQYYHWT